MEIKEENIEPSYGDILSLTRIYERVEKICSDDNIIKNPEKYFDVVGERLRKLLDNVVNDLYNQADDVAKFFSNMSLGHGVMFMTSENDDKKLDGIAFVEKLLPSKEGEFIISGLKDVKNGSDEKLSTIEMKKTFDSEYDSHKENGIVIDVSNKLGVVPKEITSDGNSRKDLNHDMIANDIQVWIEKIASGVMNEIPTEQTEGLNFLSIGQARSSSFLDASVSNSTDSLALSSEALLSISSETTLTVRNSSMQSAFLGSELQETGKLIGQNTMPDISETYVMLPENEDANSISREDEFCNPSLLSLNSEDMNDFEVIKLTEGFKESKFEDCCDDISKHEIISFSSQAGKKVLFKKNLKRMLTSKFRPSKDWELVNSHHNFHSQEFSDSDWELL